MKDNSFWKNTRYTSNGNRVPITNRNQITYNTPPHSSNNVTASSYRQPITRIRSHTSSYSSAVPPYLQNQYLNYSPEQSRSRSSSWPNKPINLNDSPINSPKVKRTRSSGRSKTKRKTSDSPTPRKKRKRLNPQRRSFYKALHNDFPAIAEALREARQGNCVIESLGSRNIFYKEIEARPPQDPSNLNVRRYNDMIFIWDPNMETWLQVPGNGEMPAMESNTGNIGNINTQQMSLSNKQDPPTFPSIQLPEPCNFTYEGPFVSDTSTSEDEDYLLQNDRNLTDFLPSDIINDVF